MQLGLEGKTAIITGGSGGIGRGLVQGFAAEGCNVVIATRDAVKGQDAARISRCPSRTRRRKTASGK
jgi:NAD(P)-dependent dehydrogenase (short-subunit alcohol dehydrogenase family)